MPVFVSPLAHHGLRLANGPVQTAFLLTDEVDLGELHRIAQAAGMRFAWFKPGENPRYSLTRQPRVLAIAAGAIECTSVELVAAMKRRREAVEEVRRALNVTNETTKTMFKAYERES